MLTSSCRSSALSTSFIQYRKSVTVAFMSTCLPYRRGTQDSWPPWVFGLHLILFSLHSREEFLVAELPAGGHLVAAFGEAAFDVQVGGHQVGDETDDGFLGRRGPGRA